MMLMARQDFYVNGEKKLNGENKFRYVSLAWNAACRLLKESDAELLWIVALDKQRLKPGDIPDAIGKKNAECLAKGGQFEVNGKNVKFYTERTLPKVCENAIVLLIHPTTSLMTKADRIPICIDCCALFLQGCSAMDRPKQAYGYFAIDVFLKDIRRVARIFTECLMSGLRPGPISEARAVARDAITHPFR
jgi:hypothetical protein